MFCSALSYTFGPLAWISGCSERSGSGHGGRDKVDGRCGRSRPTTASPGVSVASVCKFAPSGGGGGSGGGSLSRTAVKRVKQCFAGVVGDVSASVAAGVVVAGAAVVVQAGGLDASFTFRIPIVTSHLIQFQIGFWIK